MSTFWETTSGGIPYSVLVGSTVVTCCVSFQRAAEPASGPRCRWQFCGILLGVFRVLPVGGSFAGIILRAPRPRLKSTQARPRLQRTAWFHIFST